MFRKDPNINESLERTLERLEKIMERLEKRLDKLEAPTSEPAGKAAGTAEATPPPPHGPHFGPGFPFGDFPGPEGLESKRTTKEFEIKDFTGIEVGGAFEVEIVRADTYSVSVSAEEELFRNLEVSKKGDELEIRHSRHTGWRAQLSRPRAKITLPVLEELRLSGATRGTITGFNSSEDFRLELSGASKLDGDITCADAELELSGASHLRLTGSAEDMILEASGANHAELGGFSAHDVAVRLGGASHVALKMDGRLDARLGGVSHLSYIGNPTMGNIRTSGAARLSRE
ncbi:MAG: DUF2807 domain-containing protein [Chloroflexi bacterium]|nr:DUF2807 domain-containing protein [Chloroflexota bacterium]